jgi:hypothetical protein
MIEFIQANLTIHAMAVVFLIVVAAAEGIIHRRS